MPQEVPFQDLTNRIKKMAEVEFTRLELTDTSELPPFPKPMLVEVYPSRLEFAALFDYCISYVEQEAAALFSPHLAGSVCKWLEQCFPMPRERMIELFGRISLDDPRFEFFVTRAGIVAKELDKAIELCNDKRVPLAAKISVRTNLLSAVACLAAHAAKTLYEIWEGTKCT